MTQSGDEGREAILAPMPLAVVEYFNQMSLDSEETHTN